MTTIISDTFTDTDNTALSSHTPDVNTPGGSWWVTDGTIGKILSNEALPGGNAIYETYLIDIELNDNFTITCDVAWNGGSMAPAARRSNGVCLKASNLLNMVKVGWDGSVFKIEEGVSNVWTVLDSSSMTLTQDVWYELSITVENDLITATYNGVTISGTNTSLSGTEVGLTSYRDRAMWDNFLVESNASGALWAHQYRNRRS